MGQGAGSPTMTSALWRAFRRWSLVLLCMMKSPRCSMGSALSVASCSACTSQILGACAQQRVSPHHKLAGSVQTQRWRDEQRQGWAGSTSHTWMPHRSPMFRRSLPPPPQNCAPPAESRSLAAPVLTCPSAAPARSGVDRLQGRLGWAEALDLASVDRAARAPAEDRCAAAAPQARLPSIVRARAVAAHEV